MRAPFLQLFAFCTLIQLGWAAMFQRAGVPFKAPVTVAPGFSANVIFSGLTNPRGITFDSRQNLLVVEHGVGVTAFSQVNGGWERTIVVQNPDLNQGIQVDGNTLYVSSPSEMLAFRYNPVSKTVVGGGVAIVTGLPPDGELTTHTLQLEKNSAGRTVAVLIGTGPKTNIDPTARNPASGRSEIRRFQISGISQAPQVWTSGRVIADGLRNPTGFAFPPPATGIATARAQTLAIVENGAAIDNVTGISAAFANDNPAHEFNVATFPLPGANGALPNTNAQTFGFPDCASLWNPNADPTTDRQFVNRARGFQFSLELDSARGDDFCQQVANNVPPVLNFQAHSAPLDIKFFDPSTLGNAKRNGFPAQFNGNAFVSFHGSADRSPPTGYGVVRVPFPLNQQFGGGLGYSFIVQATDLTGCPTNCNAIRPVGLAFGDDGRLFVSSDATGELFFVQKGQ
ncbi:hypothetical protein CVT24_011866 [Panaeolus cyanescens]|uniref:Pyrroloquinoline quinone-dependent pyranose dehydrogenase beta-propeller domain-containing protein n=1 Tax=Panaeolus cyanescens TaxID=181874 RepID=A0A409YNM4_9AGAR|nr:hypothetical protein CVT24_011866 [Panaeolus cyanescens]